MQQHHLENYFESWKTSLSKSITGNGKLHPKIELNHLICTGEFFQFR